MNQKIAIDLGYSSTKVFYNGEYYTFPTAIQYGEKESMTGYGENKSIFYEGDFYIVGKPDTETFATHSYSFIKQFGKLIFYSIFKQLGISPEDDIEVATGLALADWKYIEDFKEDVIKIEANYETYNIRLSQCIPQGAAAFFGHLIKKDIEAPSTATVIDIGFNTVNVLYFENGRVNMSNKLTIPYINHGVVNIISPFANQLESMLDIPFSNAEALKIFTEKKLTISGEEISEIPEMVDKLRFQFLDKLIKTILIKQKKQLDTSELVLFAGGGSYFIGDAFANKRNVQISDEYEYANAVGYYNFAWGQ